MELVLQLLINGVVAGAIFALMAVGFALFYFTTRIFHVAHGAIFTVGAYSLFAAAKILKLPLPVSIGAALVTATLIGIGVELVGYRPLRARGASLASCMIGSFGIFIILQNLTHLGFGGQPRFVREAPLTSYPIAGASVTFLHMAVIASGLVIFPALHLFLSRTKQGKAIRALADNAELAVAIGMDSQRLYLVIAALGSFLAGISAVFVTLDTGATLEYGFSVILIAAVSAIIGGVGHLPGAAIAAFMLGIIQNLSVIKFSPQWQEAVAFAVFGLFLIFLPQGLFGARLAGRKS